MKYIKLFESHNDDERIKEFIESGLVDLVDQGYSVSVTTEKKGWYLSIEAPVLDNEEDMDDVNIIDVRDIIEPIIDYMKITIKGIKIYYWYDEWSDELEDLVDIRRNVTNGFTDEDNEIGTQKLDFWFKKPKTKKKD